MKRLLLLKNPDDVSSKLNINMFDYVLIDLDNFNLKNILDKDDIEKEYKNFIASMSSNISSDYWWASNLSEKNSFTSKLFVRLYKLACLDAKIKKYRNKDIAVVCSDLALSKQIIFNYKKNFVVSNLCFSPLEANIKALLCKLIGILAQIKKACYEYKNLLFTRCILFTRRTAILKKDDYVVLRTWCDNRSYKSGSYFDPYFKNLLSFFSGQKRNILIFAGILSDYRDMIKKFKEDTENIIIPFNFYLKGLDIFKCVFNVYFKRPSIKGNIFFCDCNVKFLVFEELLQDMNGTRFFDALLQYYSCTSLTRSIRIERFIYTFENYAWEKMSILGLRYGDPNIKVLGFQHAFVSKNSFKYFPGFIERDRMPLPNKIITMGRRTLDIMNRLGCYPDNIFSVGCALRQNYLSPSKLLPRRTTRDIFVALTITVEDAVKVLRFLFDSGLGKYPEKLYIRFHPATCVNEVMKDLGFKMPSNFIISNNLSVTEEIERCGVILYTWTTVCLEALKMGCPAIYLDVNYPLEVDPLFECNSKIKDSCSNPAELRTRINKILNIDDNLFYEELRKTQDYLKDYFVPVSEDNMKIFSEVL
ncbi:MAG: hypothetical protein P9L93_06765 [Candidatus Gorgyraea atricola]|nr:hypothetical protein [Candidatus Gorgyraea atricola]